MEKSELEQLRYPIGRFSFPDDVTKAEVLQCISDIEILPSRVKQAVKSLSSSDFNLIYRPDGWSIKQLVNHLIDSHSNSVIRFKLALTEDTPTIRPYLENKWALLADTELCPIDLSLNLLDNLHQRWTILLRSMTDEDWERKLFHPEHKKEFTLKQFAALYAWHCKHHLAHIELAKKSNESVF